jgi:hypothetical protein
MVGVGMVMRVRLKRRVMRYWREVIAAGDGEFVTLVDNERMFLTIKKR